MVLRRLRGDNESEDDDEDEEEGDGVSRGLDRKGLGGMAGHSDDADEEEGPDDDDSMEGEEEEEEEDEEDEEEEEESDDDDDDDDGRESDREFEERDSGDEGKEETKAGVETSTMTKSQKQPYRNGIKTVSMSAPGDLAFVYECPTSPAEFAKLLDGHNPEDCRTILMRVIACHNVHLDGRNRSKMEVRQGNMKDRPLSE